MSGYRIKRQNYSRGAWRVLDAETGAQVWRTEIFEDPMLGTIRISEPVCFQRKRDAVAWIAAQG